MKKGAKKNEIQVLQFRTPGNAGDISKPKNNPAMLIHNFNSREYVPEIGRIAWGYIEYDKPLENKDIDGYELMPAAFFS